MKLNSPFSAVKTSFLWDWKWVVLFSCFAIRALKIGPVCWGVLLRPLKDQFNQDVWLLGIIVSISNSFGDFIGPLVGGISKRLGCRAVVMLGGFILCSGLVFASLANDISQFTVFLFLGMGLGFGCTNDVPFAVMGRYFQDDFSLANGFATTGSSFGFTLLGPLTAYLVDVYGWRGALLFLGAINFNITALGAILKDPERPDNLLVKRDKKTYETIKDKDHESYETIKDKDHESGFEKFWNLVVQSLDITLFKEAMFIRILVVCAIMRFTQMAWVIYLVPNVISKGVSSLSASLISTTAGIGVGVGQLLPGIVTSVTNNYLSSRTLWTIGITITSVTLVIDALVDSYVAMLILGACQGLGSGMMVVTYRVVLYDEFGKERLVNSMGWVRGIGGFSRVIGGFLPGWIYQVTSSYHWSYVILGVIQALAVFILHIGRIFSHCAG
ncbi:monocarboxylate transporter 2-like [Amphiura filiformis]|uniref:monocarboxylate transporter 2-like n=1 Tax=Amphiura filiformis TaxID=82378 RepID=UPI003B21AFE6